MSSTKPPHEEAVPRSGRVNEVCQEWMVREDSALAYRLQNQEFVEHLSGNRFRNALVREDFPTAKNEQIKEQEMAEQAAAIYQRMLQEQEEHDQKVAKELADKLEREERLKKRAIELRDQDVARQLLEQERHRVEKHQQLPQTSRDLLLDGPMPLPPRMPREQKFNYSEAVPPLPKRQGLPMPLPQENNPFRSPQKLSVQRASELTNADSAELYTEPYKSSKLTDNMNRIDVVPDIRDDLNASFDDLTLRQIQEEKDAELARKLQQEEEGNAQDSILARDRLLAIEAQDKELAKLLQERERAKAKRARERAKQKALAKRQQNQQQEPGPGSIPDCIPVANAGQIMPDDSYALPADIITHPQSGVPKTVSAVPDIYTVPNPDEEDIRYSLPADVLPEGPFKSPGQSPQRAQVPGIGSLNGSAERGGGSRPTHLELKSPLNRISKPRMPDPEFANSDVTNTSSGSLSGGTSPLHSNIAMAIDPTYPKRGSGYRPSSSYDTTSSTVTTSTSSSSPGMVLPPPEICDNDDESPAPPYMPIQGQRRTASLEKKKKKTKDGGCKQQ